MLGESFLKKYLVLLFLLNSVCFAVDAFAQSVLDKAKEKEQSTVNKLLGGASMVATGIGGWKISCFDIYEARYEFGYEQA